MDKTYKAVYRFYVLELVLPVLNPPPDHLTTINSVLPDTFV